jgi:hypothetical protein
MIPGDCGGIGMNKSGHEKKSYGCLGYGCLIAISLIILVGASLAWLITSSIRSSVETYTAKDPVEIISPVMSSAAAVSLQGKLADLSRMSSDPSVGGEFLFTSEELSALVMLSPFSRKLTVSTAGDSILAQFSFRMSDVGNWQTARWLVGGYLDRYVNGSADANVLIENGVTMVTLRALTLNGRKFEDAALKGASKWVSGALDSAMGAAAQDDAVKASLLGRVERVWIVDGVVHVRFRAG